MTRSPPDWETWTRKQSSVRFADRTRTGSGVSAITDDDIPEQLDHEYWIDTTSTHSRSPGKYQPLNGSFNPRTVERRAVIGALKETSPEIAFPTIRTP